MFCIYCGAGISPEARFCGICGNSRHISLDEPTTLCASCQQANPLHATFCQYCGKRLKEEEHAPQIGGLPVILEPVSELGLMHHVEPDPLSHPEDLSPAEPGDTPSPIPEEAPQAGLGEVSHSGLGDLPHAGSTDVPHTDMPHTDPDA